MGKRAVFLDRDGTLNVEVNYLSRVEDFQLLPGVIPALRALDDRGWPSIVITNQAGIGRGYYTVADMEAVHARLHQELAAAGTGVAGIYYCPHHPDAGCACRKPGPLLFEQAARDFGLDLARCYAVGDKLSDLIPARRLGCRTVLVLTGYGAQELTRTGPAGFQPDSIAPDLLQAVEWILKTESEA